MTALLEYLDFCTSNGDQSDPGPCWIIFNTNPVIMPSKVGYKVDLMSIWTISDHYNYAKTKVHYNLQLYQLSKV